MFKQPHKVSWSLRSVFDDRFADRLALDWIAIVPGSLAQQPSIRADATFGAIRDVW